MMGSKTSCRNVCAIHATITTTFPEASAPGSEISARSAKAIAVHIVPTADVMLSPQRSRVRLKRFAILGFIVSFTVAVYGASPQRVGATARVPTYAHDTLNATIARDKNAEKPELPTTHVE